MTSLPAGNWFYAALAVGLASICGFLLAVPASGAESARANRNPRPAHSHPPGDVWPFDSRKPELGADVPDWYTRPGIR
ncbi:hypothetical protein EX238_25270 [Providencia rettgeri]|nr:hypothetical protein [Providencia rettgeri]